MEALQVVATTVQVLSVVAGVVVSVLSFNAARRKESEARQLELAKPFLQLRQNLYLEAAKCAGVLTNAEVHTADEVAQARKRFRALYVAELSMVEAPEVEREMFAFARIVDQEVTTLTDEQNAAYVLSHALRDSFLRSWGLEGTPTVAARSR
jgi:hypothetical protein